MRLNMQTNYITDEDQQILERILRLAAENTLAKLLNPVNQKISPRYWRDLRKVRNYIYKALGYDDFNKCTLDLIEADLDVIHHTSDK